MDLQEQAAKINNGEGDKVSKPRKVINHIIMIYLSCTILHIVLALYYIL